MTKYPLTSNSKVELFPVEFISIDQIVVEEQNIGPASKQILQTSINNWSKALGGRLSYVLKLAGDEEETIQIIFSNDGLLNEFASLKSHKDIEYFSKTHGLLGIQHPDTEQVNSPHPAIQATLQPPFIFTLYGESVLEPIELWEWHIKEVQQILKLYHAIRKAKSEDYLNNIIEIKMERGPFGSSIDDKRIYDRYFVYWTNGELILMLPSEYEEKSMLEIAVYTLAKIIQSRISRGVNLGVGDIIFNPSTKGFKTIEERYTNNLLAAIYYELWQTINDSKNIYICENKNCRSPFVKSGRKKYCNEACKQEAYRIRVKEKEGKDK